MEVRNKSPPQQEKKTTLEGIATELKEGFKNRLVDKMVYFLGFALLHDGLVTYISYKRDNLFNTPSDSIISTFYGISLITCALLDDYVAGRKRSAQKSESRV